MVSPPAEGPLRLAPVAAALIASALLAQEILIARLLSVTTWYSLGYLALSLGLLGMSVGALAVHLWPRGFSPERMSSSLTAALALASLLTCAASAWLVRIPVVLEVDHLPQTLLSLLQLSVVIALPFAAGGAALAALLTRAQRPGLVYGADLAGSALGALLAAPAISLLGAPRALAATALLPALAIFMVSSGRGVRLKAALMMLLVLPLVLSPDALALRHIKGLPVSKVPPTAEGWNSISHVRAPVFFQGPPIYWGELQDAPQAPVSQAFLKIDGEAGTVSCAFKDLRTDLDYLRYDLTSAVHWLRPSGEVLVIGVGGGRDIATALLYGHPTVTGVDVNPLIVDMLRGPLAEHSPLARQPGVVLHVEDGRSWLARSPERFKVIVASLVDTWAATGMGAMTLTENSLYTREAWRLFLDRLQPEGIVSFSRWYDPERPLEIARLVALAAAALRDRGVTEPSGHMLLVARGRLANILVSPSPLRPEDVEVMRERARSGGVRLLLAPGEPPASPWLAAVAEARDDARLDALAADSGVDLTATTDDRPFFFLQVPLSAWLSPSRIRELGEGGGGMIRGNVVAVGAVAAAFGIASLLAVVWILPPLWRRKGTMAPLGRAGRLTIPAWFAALGMGFMVFEIATAQRLHLLLGDPTWALALTLAPLTLAAGLGATLSERLDPTSGRTLLLLPGIAAGVIALWALVPSSVISAVLARSFMERALICVLVAGLPGIVLGFLFPLGLRRVLAVAPEAAAWCWGVNGVLSVVGSGAAVFLSVSWGIGATLACAAGIYGLLALVAPSMARLTSPATRDRSAAGL
jgi:spermidine synthase